MLARLNPVRWAMERVDQWVASAGLDSSVSVSTRSTSSSLNLREVPGRCSSSRPSIPLSKKRCLHFPAVCSVVDTCAAMAVLLSPSAANKTIRARRARAWAVVRRRLQESNCFRSLSATDSGANGRPASAFSYSIRCSGPFYL
jgi:predicted DNA-binding transcriptional regulator AlpA